jgi:hypothetical protein
MQALKQDAQIKKLLKKVGELGAHMISLPGEVDSQTEKNPLPGELLRAHTVQI